MELPTISRMHTGCSSAGALPLQTPACSLFTSIRSLLECHPPTRPPLWQPPSRTSDRHPSAPHAHFPSSLHPHQQTTELIYSAYCSFSAPSDRGLPPQEQGPLSDLFTDESQAPRMMPKTWLGINSYLLSEQA